MAQNILYHREVKPWHFQETCWSSLQNFPIHSVPWEYTGPSPTFVLILAGLPGRGRL